MKKYSVGMVRERLSQALDEAQQGIPVFIERRGVRYRISVERKTAAAVKRPYIHILDPAIERGEWSWDWRPAGMTFKARRRGR